MIGGGPIAIEVAQAVNRLGISVTVLQRGPSILPRDEPTLTAVLQRRLIAEGVDLVVGAEVTKVSADGNRRHVEAVVDGVTRSWSAEAVFVATGRLPNVEGLGLTELGAEIGPAGMKVDDRGRTSIKSIYVAGDVAGRNLFTHSAGYEGVRAVRDMFFPGKGAVTEFIPWCTFTDPELAHAGLTITEAEDRHGDDVDVWRLDLSHSDRARADGSDDGAIIVITAKGRIVGSHILAPGAGEMIHELALAINQNMKLSDVAGLVHVYPTLSTGIGQLAAESSFEKAQKLRWLVKRAR
jgi:pyruvate/2-oxoglutarate dehydrogenase complex dihydrolipoamide dehydrogenase (E3) component